MGTVRHFTATGYLVHENSVFLHWHEKLSMWLPPGGHIEENEDPVQAVLREIFEETGLEAVIIENDHKMTFSFKYPQLVSSPRYIMIEDVDDPRIGPHKHIDLIYYCRSLNGVENIKQNWVAVDYNALKQNKMSTNDDVHAVSLADDVREMSMEAICINLNQFTS